MKHNYFHHFVWKLIINKLQLYKFIFTAKEQLSYRQTK